MAVDRFAITFKETTYIIAVGCQYLFYSRVVSYFKSSIRRNSANLGNIALVSNQFILCESRLLSTFTSPNIHIFIHTICMNNCPYQLCLHRKVSLFSDMSNNSGQFP